MGPSRAATLKEIVQEMNVGTMFDTKGEVNVPFKLVTCFLVDIPCNHFADTFLCLQIWTAVHVRISRRSLAWINEDGCVEYGLVIPANKGGAVRTGKNTLGQVDRKK